MFELPTLPYPYAALEPSLSRLSVKRHYEDNHAGYVRKANLLNTKGLPPAVVLQKEPLGSPLYNAAAQDWAHTFWWWSMAPVGTGGAPPPEIGDVVAFRKQWVAAGSSFFGSGWLWLVVDGDKLSIMTTTNATLPPRRHERPGGGLARVPLLVSDLWEHAYYCEYGTNKTEYLTRFFDVVNWNAVRIRLGRTQ